MNAKNRSSKHDFQMDYTLTGMVQMVTFKGYTFYAHNTSSKYGSKYLWLNTNKPVPIK